VVNAPPRGKCVHCLRQSSPLTWDHVFPRAWYPDTTAPDLEKWRIPACLRCNREYGKIEEDLLTYLGLCINPDTAAAAGIATKVLRSLDPAYARNARDARARQAKWQKIMGKVLTGERIPKTGHYPGLARTLDHPFATNRAFLVPARLFRRLTEKIVRGIFYIDREAFIEPPFVIEHFALTDEGAAPIQQVLDRFGTDFAREPGILVRRALAKDNEMSSLFSIEIWKAFKMFATVDDPTRAGADPRIGSLRFGARG
jgi:hypothetical protein